MVPDALFPSEPEFDIPLLDPRMQATHLELPYRGWNKVPRHSKFGGTWHFYVDDRHFSAVWKNPDTLVKTQCLAAVEVNYSTHEQYPRALFLADLYRKRWISRYWQSMGVKIWVDLNIHPLYLEQSLIGVPPGWKAFATRAKDSELSLLGEHLAIAHRFTDHPLMVVLSSGPKVQAFCARNQLIYVKAEATWVTAATKESEECRRISSPASPKPDWRDLRWVPQLPEESSPAPESRSS